MDELDSSIALAVNHPPMHLVHLVVRSSKDLMTDFNFVHRLVAEMWIIITTMIVTMI